MQQIRVTLVAMTLAAIPFGGVNADTAPILLIHGGAGTISRQEMPADREAAFRAALASALESGYAVLDEGGSALDAVTVAIVMMEDDELFNAGRGAVFTHQGRNEMDAAIMDGATRSAGAVAAVHLVKNPILLARQVMENSPHVLLVGTGAEEFAVERHMELRPPSYFRTERRWRQLLERIDSQASADPGGHLGTVGAVALDRNGNLAAGTSTGGMTDKHTGRVGDSPIIGAGTYADNDSCAVSATGQGEYFMRAVIAHDICARVRYLEESPLESATSVVMQELVTMGGEGGVIVLDRTGGHGFVFNTGGMYRGVIQRRGQPRVAIFGDEKL
jgi:beta-aspartyl-peptidase (threonine type)